MNKFVKIIAVLGVVIFSCTVAMAAKRSHSKTNNYYIAASLGGNFGTTLTASEDEIDSSTWVGGLQIGQRIHPNFRIEAAYQYLDDADLSDEFAASDVSINVLTVNAIYDITDTKFVPYVMAGFGYGWFDVGNVDVDDSGTMANFGCGVDYHISKTVSIGARYTYLTDTGWADYNSNLIQGVVTYNF